MQEIYDMYNIFNNLHKLNVKLSALSINFRLIEILFNLSQCKLLQNNSEIFEVSLLTRVLTHAAHSFCLSIVDQVQASEARSFLNK